MQDHVQRAANVLQEREPSLDQPTAPGGRRDRGGLIATKKHKLTTIVATAVAALALGAPLSSAASSDQVAGSATTATSSGSIGDLDW
jgi:hypothetical protein